MRCSILKWLDRSMAWVSVVVAFGMLTGGYVAQWMGYTPCTLCFYERYTLMGLGITSLLIWLLRIRFFWIRYLLGLGWLGLGFLGFYHVSLQWGWLPLPAFCSVPPLPEGSVEELTKILLSRPFVPCNRISLAIFGVPVPFFIGCIGVIMFFLERCWVYRCMLKHKM